MIQCSMYSAYLHWRDRALVISIPSPGHACWTQVRHGPSPSWWGTCPSRCRCPLCRSLRTPSPPSNRTRHTSWSRSSPCFLFGRSDPPPVGGSVSSRVRYKTLRAAHLAHLARLVGTLPRAWKAKLDWAMLVLGLETLPGNTRCSKLQDLAFCTNQPPHYHPLNYQFKSLHFTEIYQVLHQNKYNNTLQQWLYSFIIHLSYSKQWNTI